MKILNRITFYNEISYRKRLIKLAANFKAKKMVDLGCWDGKFSKEIANQVGAKVIYGIDHDEKSLKKFSKNFNKTWACDLNDKLPLENASVDLVLANQVIEHIAKTDSLIKEIERILKPKGIVLMATPNLSSWHNIGSLVLGYQPFASQVSDVRFIGNPLHPQYYNKINEAQAHLRVFTHFSLADLFRLHNLLPEIIIGAGYYPFMGKLADLLARFDKKHSAYVLIAARKK